MTPLIVHAHIPKCAGSTLNYILGRYFRTSTFSSYTDLYQPRYANQHFQDVAIRFSGTRVFSGHTFSWQIEPPFPERRRVVVLSLVRDPLKHFVSNYFFLKRMGIDPLINRMEIEECGEYLFGGERLADHANFQTHWLSGKRDRAGLEMLGRKIEDHGWLLACVQDFDDLCLILERSDMGIPDASYKRVNVENRKPYQASKRLKSLVENAQSIDYELQELARKSLQKRLLELYSIEELEAARKDFSSRCNSWKHQINYQINLWWGRIRFRAQKVQF